MTFHLEETTLPAFFVNNNNNVYVWDYVWKRSNIITWIGNGTYVLPAPFLQTNSASTGFSLYAIWADINKNGQQVRWFVNQPYYVGKSVVVEKKYWHTLWCNPLDNKTKGYFKQRVKGSVLSRMVTVFVMDQKGLERDY